MRDYKFLRRVITTNFNRILHIKKRVTFLFSFLRANSRDFSFAKRIDRTLILTEKRFAAEGTKKIIGGAK
jgi:hypothetical protein